MNKSKELSSHVTTFPIYTEKYTLSIMLYRSPSCGIQVILSYIITQKYLSSSVVDNIELPICKFEVRINNLILALWNMV